LNQNLPDSGIPALDSSQTQYALDASAGKDPPLLERSRLEHAQEGNAGKECAPPEPGERFLSVAEVAKRLGVSEKTVRRKIESGDLPAHRVGKLIRVTERDLAAYLPRPGGDDQKQ
jgi:excisionase family DNA binding protein